MAINLARLRIQTAELASYAHQPEKFTRRLLELLDFYADRTLRPGKRRPLPTLLTVYQVPAPVMRQIEGELHRVLDADTPSALTLADALWKQESLECRQLAIHLLQRADPSPPEPILERYRSWATPDVDGGLLDLLLAQGQSTSSSGQQHFHPNRAQARLHSAHPEAWLSLITGWLNHSEPGVRGLGLRAMRSLANDPSFENLPALYRLTNPLLRDYPPALLPELAALIDCLARRSPAETSFFLRQAMSAGRGPGLVRLVRRCLPAFPDAQQESLRRQLVVGSG